MTALSYLRELNDALRDRERYQSVTLEQLNADRDKRNVVLIGRVLRSWIRRD